jgi:hypothetical protein
MKRLAVRELRLCVLILCASVAAVGCVDRHIDLSTGPINPWAPQDREPIEPDGGEVSDLIPPEDRAVGRCAFQFGDGPLNEGTLKISFLTKVSHGLYSPRNYGAVWIEDVHSKYVRTLEVWAGSEHQNAVVQWYVRSCRQELAAAGATPDAVTSATLPGPEIHELAWDGKASNGEVVPDGDYKVWMQVTEDEIFPEGPFVGIAFTKGTSRQVTTVDETEGFKDIKLEYVPRSLAANAM